MSPPADPEKAFLLNQEQLRRRRPRHSRSRVVVLLVAAAVVVVVGLVYIWGPPRQLAWLSQLSLFERRQVQIKWPRHTAALPKGSPLPVVVWHGLGDWHRGAAVSLIEEAAMSAYGESVVVYPVHFSEDESKERSLSFFGDIQYDVLAQVCSMLTDAPVFKNGFVGVGLSQGGLFLRVLQQKCPQANMKSLITLGSPHQGFSDAKGALCDYIPYVCGADWLRKLAFSSYVQNHIVPLTYYKPVDLHEEYLAGSRLLGVFNFENMLDQHSVTNMNKLEKFVMVMFKDDTKLVPSRSAWFDDLNREGNRVDMKDTPSYRTIGLDLLDKSGKLHREAFDGDHLNFSAAQIAELFCRYAGGNVSCQNRK